MGKTSGAGKEALTCEELLQREYGTKMLFTYPEVCEILGCCRGMVHKMVHSKKLEIRRIGKSPRVTRLSLVNYLTKKTPARRKKKCADKQKETS